MDVNYTGLDRPVYSIWEDRHEHTVGTLGHHARSFKHSHPTLGPNHMHEVVWVRRGMEYYYHLGETLYKFSTMDRLAPGKEDN